MYAYESRSTRSRQRSSFERQDDGDFTGNCRETDHLDAQGKCTLRHTSDYSLTLVDMSQQLTTDTRPNSLPYGLCSSFGVSDVRQHSAVAVLLPLLP